MPQTIKILIVDDHQIVRAGLRAMIKPKPNIEVIGEAADGDEAVQQARDLQPDVILMDLLMPRKDGLSAIREIRQNNPAARILALTSFAGDDKVLTAIKAGVQGYLFKDAHPHDLFQAIQSVYRGETLLDTSLALTPTQKVNRPSKSAFTRHALTARETETLKLIAQGLSNHEIAAELFVSKRTVSARVSAILRKLRVGNRIQATLYALREGLTELPQQVNSATKVLPSSSND